MARAHFVKSARKSYKAHGIKKGESYWWWKFNRQPKQYSKTEPTRSQLTQSGFLQTLYGIEDDIAAFDVDSKERFDDEKQMILSSIEELKDECQSSLDAMPEHLQDTSDSGILLSERISGLEDWYNEIDQIECDYDEDEIKTNIAIDEGWDEKDVEQQDIDNKIVEIIGDAISQLQDASHGL